MCFLREHIVREHIVDLLENVRASESPLECVLLLENVLFLMNADAYIYIYIYDIIMYVIIGKQNCIQCDELKNLLGGREIQSNY